MIGKVSQWGKRWRYLDLAASPHRSRIGALEGTAPGRNSPRKAGTPVERSKENGGENEFLRKVIMIKMITIIKVSVR